MSAFEVFLVIYIILINIMSYITMYIDKQFAINKKTRISEKTLLTLALFLGSIGIYFGIYSFRHKTRHKKFTIGVPVIFIINIIVVYYLLTSFQGFLFLK